MVSLRRSLSCQIIYEKNNVERRDICERVVQLDLDLYKRCHVPALEEGEEQMKELKDFQTVPFLARQILRKQRQSV